MIINKLKRIFNGHHKLKRIFNGHHKNDSFYTKILSFYKKKIVENFFDKLSNTLFIFLICPCLGQRQMEKYFL